MQTFVSSMGRVTNQEKVFDLEADAEPIPDVSHEDEGFGPEASHLGADDFNPEDDVDDAGLSCLYLNLLYVQLFL